MDQEEWAEETTITIGRKVVLKLQSEEDGTYIFQTIENKPFDKDVAMLEWGNREQLFEEEGEKGTIVFYFVKEPKENGKSHILLIMKSYCDEFLQYDSDILVHGTTEFQSTSNDGISPKAIGTEIWPYDIDVIKISNVRKVNL